MWEFREGCTLKNLAGITGEYGGPLASCLVFYFNQPRNKKIFYDKILIFDECIMHILTFSIKFGPFDPAHWK